jgi:hypothetical protein
MDVDAVPCAPLSFESVLAQKLAPALEVEPPRTLLELDASGRSRERFSFASDPLAFRLDDATGYASLACSSDWDGSATAVPSRIGAVSVGV